MKYDFSGYATRYNVKCTDGRTIMPGAFAHNDKKKIPLFWQHDHDSVMSVVGHAILEHREDGVYAYGFLNSTEQGIHCKGVVEHKDIESLSVYARQVKESSKQVTHGNIKEVSLVMSGANPGAKIDYVHLEHSDDQDVIEHGEAIIWAGPDIVDIDVNGGEYEDAIMHSDNQQDDDEDLEHSDKTMQEVFDSLDEDQKKLFFAVGAAIVEGDDVEHSDEEDEDGVDDQDDEDDEDVEHSDDNDDSDDDELEHSDNEGGNEDMARKRPFENGAVETSVLKHSDVASIFEIARKDKSKLSDAIIKHMQSDAGHHLEEAYLKHCEEEGTEIKHAQSYGIENIGALFPEAKAISNTPEFDKRRTEWVSVVLNNVHMVPWSRIKSLYADITEETARAKGYMKGTEKTEEVFPILKRETSPTTIYKKQKLDRDDILDITDFDVVMWLKAEMRLMLDEERARAYLIGDGRDAASLDKIKEDCIRPIYKEHDKYAIKVRLAANKVGLDELEAVKMSRKDYKGSGRPMFFTTPTKIIDWTLLKDANQNYRFRDAADVARFLNVTRLVEVEVMEGVERDFEGTMHELIGIMVNLKDYTTGADKGGRIGLFDDFDIDFNQYKYLMETRCSGALTKLYSAVVIEKAKAV